MRLTELVRWLTLISEKQISFGNDKEENKNMVPGLRSKTWAPAVIEYEANYSL